MISLLSIVPLISSCDDTEERRNRYSEKKPPPAPMERPVTPMSTNFPSESKRKDRVKPSWMMYNGEDMIQITGLSGRKVFLVFYASWCPHSLAYIEAMKQYANSEKGKSLAVFIDADVYPDMAKRYNVEATPTTILYVEGMNLRTMVGNVSEARLRKLVSETLTVQ